MNVLRPFTVSGRKVRAHITKPSDALKVMLPARSLAHIPSKYRVQPGQVICDDRGHKWLLADHHSYSDRDVFLAMLINCSVTHTVYYEGIHPTTKMGTGKFKAFSNSIPGVMEIGDPAMDKGMLVSRDVYYFGQPVANKDKIENQSVTKVTQLAGVYRVEVS